MRIGAILAVLLLLGMLFTVPVKADLSRIYQSDDVDLPAKNISTTSPEQLAKYYDFVFLRIPEKIGEQNRRFIADFPFTNVWSSAVPKGVRPASNGVIRDAYIKLVPISGFVKVGNSFSANKTAVVGYIADYRIQLPPDVTAGYPKHYYSLVRTSVEVKISSGGCVKEGASLRGTVCLKVEGDIWGIARITAVVKETIKEKHRECYTDCHTENGTTTCETWCETYIYTYHRYHTYELTVKDEIKIVKPGLTEVFELMKDGHPLEYCIRPGITVARIIDDSGTVVLDGLRYLTTYRIIKQAVIYDTVGKSSSTSPRTVDLKEPAYVVAAVPSYDLLPLPACTIESVKTKKGAVEVPNFKSDAPLFDVENICIMYPKNVTLVDFFGNPVRVDLHVKRLVKPKVSVDVKSRKGKYRILMHITYAGLKYTGPVFVTLGTKTYEFNASAGTLDFTVNSSGMVNYYIPSNLPKNWYETSTNIFSSDVRGSFYVGKASPYLLPLYELGIVVAGIFPFILFAYVLRRVFTEEEEEYL